MKLPITLLLALTTSSVGISQDYYSDFVGYLQKGDTNKQIETLKEWEKSDPNNPELFTSYFNYYFMKSEKEVIAMTAEQPEGESLVLSDSLNDTEFYLGSEIMYDPVDLENAFTKIDEGIRLYPNRLDMRFGKIFVIGKTKDWERFTKEIIVSIQYSSVNENQWTWTNNTRKEDGKDFFLSGLQGYQLQLYNTEEDSLLSNMQEIATEVLKYYPDHIESLTNLSITYLLTKEYDKGIEVLLRAEKLNPQDVIVLANIANGYTLLENKKMAIKYYEKIIEFGDNQSISFARQQIEELSK